MCARHHNEFRAVEAVNGYGVDMAESHPLWTVARTLGLSSDGFYEDNEGEEGTGLYVDLPALRDEIRSHIVAGKPIIWISGSVGTGKTTFVRYVLRDLQKNGRVVLSMDFRRLKQESLSRTRSFSACADWLTSNLRQKLEAVMEFHRIEARHLLPVLAVSDHMLSEDGAAARRALRNRFGGSAAATEGSDDAHFQAWLTAQVRERGGPHEAQILAFVDALRLDDLLYALPRLPNTAVFDKPIIVHLDNLDSIWCLGLRANLCQWMLIWIDRLQASVTLVAAVRPENKQRYVEDARRQTGDEVADFDVQREDANSVNVGMVNSDDASRHALPPDEEARVLEWLRFNTRDADGLARRGTQVFTWRSFDAAMVRRRCEYVRRRAESGEPIQMSDGTVLNLDGLRMIERMICELRRKEYLRLGWELDALGNGNGRDKLVNAGNLVEHLIANYGMQPLGADEDLTLHRRLQVESLFYQWLPRSAHIEQAVDLCNPVRAAEEIRHSQEEVVDDCPVWIHGFRHEIILAAIFKLCGLSWDRHRAGRARVAEVVRRCRAVGLPQDTVLEVIRMMIVSPQSPSGMIESTNYYRIREGILLDGTDEVTLTDRACQLLQHLSCRFFYVATLMARARVRVREGDSVFTCPPDGSVSQRLFADVLSYLRLLATIQLKSIRCALESMRTTRVLHADESADRYGTLRRWFCLNAPGPEPRRPAFWTERMLIVQQKYLNQLRKDAVARDDEALKDAVSDDLVSEFEQLRVRFVTLADELGAGQTPLLPDGPLQIT